jgi:hypothetical protein
MDAAIQKAFPFRSSLWFPPIVWTVSREMVGDPAVIAIRIAQLSGFQLCC